MKENKRKCKIEKNEKKSWKNEKNEKMKKLRKMMKQERKMKKNGFTRKILYDFQGSVSECVSFPRKINNPFWEVSVFQKKSDNFHWTWNKNTHFFNENQQKNR